MESVKSIILFPTIALVLILGITLIVNVLYMVIEGFYEFFSRPKCPNCAGAIGKRTIRCLYCGSALGKKRSQKEIKNMDPELYARVKAFVAEETGVSPKKFTKLTSDTDLFEGLGIAGDDGYDLLEAFCEAFEIENMSEINPYKYFGPEGCNLFHVYIDLYYLVFDREKLQKLKDTDSLTPLCLRDLVKSAEAKRWIPPEAT